MANKLTREQLRMRQAMPLEDKIRYSKRRIEEWVEHFGENHVYVSFSGGKDSTVLLHLVRSMYPNVKAMFVDTGLEYPEVKEYVKSFDNMDIIRPKMMFNKVIERYGFPVISKEQSMYLYEARNTTSDYLRKKRMGEFGKSFSIAEKWRYLLNAPFKISHMCCKVMKKNPAHSYTHKYDLMPFVGTTTDESKLREQKYLQVGCNAFNNVIPTSTPIAFWKEQDILEYIVKYNVPFCKVYGKIVKNEKGEYETTGVPRTGCMFCGFGCHLEKEPNRFQKLAKTHPKQYDYIINKLGMGEVLDYIGVDYREVPDGKTVEK